MWLRAGIGAEVAARAGGAGRFQGVGGAACVTGSRGATRHGGFGAWGSEGRRRSWRLVSRIAAA